MYKPDLGLEEVSEVISHALLLSVDRGCISGWGGTVHVVDGDQGCRHGRCGGLRHQRLASVDDLAVDRFHPPHGRIRALVWLRGRVASRVSLRRPHAGAIRHHHGGERGLAAAALRVHREPSVELGRLDYAGLRLACRPVQRGGTRGVLGAGEGADPFGGECVQGDRGRRCGDAGERDGEARACFRSPRCCGWAFVWVVGLGHRHGAAGVLVPHIARRAVRGHQVEPGWAHGGRAPAAPPCPARGARHGEVRWSECSRGASACAPSRHASRVADAAIFPSLLLVI